MATFTPLGHLKQVTCPEGRQCRLFHCLFSHDNDKELDSTTPIETPPEWLIKAAATNTPLVPDKGEKKSGQRDEPPNKRRRLDPHSSINNEVISPARVNLSKRSAHREDPTRTDSSAASKTEARRPPLATLEKQIKPPTAASRSTANTSTAARPNISQIPRPSSTALTSRSNVAATASAVTGGGGGGGPVRPTTRRQVKKEPLNPRHIVNPPTSHTTRLAILKKLHETMDGLNKKTIAKYKDEPSKRELIMLEHEMVGMALDLEEEIAKENATLYNNVVRLRIVRLMKMTQVEWEKEVVRYMRLDATGVGEGGIAAAAAAAATTRTAVAAGTSTAIVPSATATRAIKKVANQGISTGLQPSEERLILPRFLARPEDLAERGTFILSRPTGSSIEDARQAATLARNWEKCERCGGRFQVFPGRRTEDGVLATNGPCHFHPMRAYIPRTTKTDHIVGQKEATYPCCSETVGKSKGCTRCEYHVWKTSSPARLAAVLQFEKTPEVGEEKEEVEGEGEGEGGDKKQSRREYPPLTFDCEMSYTTLGLELTRLTAVTWPENHPVIDVLVRPYGEILDFNTRYSGVSAKLFAKAYPYGEPPPPKEPAPATERVEEEEDAVPHLPMVDSPAAARSLLFSHLRPSTPLIGHAIDNDLNACRIIHPSIIDTALLYPHPRKGYTYSLRTLAYKYLGRQIQSGGGKQGGVEGHDSLEDAVATGDLVRVKVGEMWSSLRSTGWRFNDDVDGKKLISPRGRVVDDLEESRRRMLTAATAGMKRKA